MTITQTVEIPANRRVILEVPRETPIGMASMEYKIIPFINKNAKGREFGCSKGKYQITDTFFEPLEDFKDYM